MQYRKQKQDTRTSGRSAIQIPSSILWRASGGVMAERTPLENAVAKLILMAELQGMTIDDLIGMMESGASVADIVLALIPHGRQCA